ncbi:MAG: enoyl-CoA hydratase-related protein [Microscillaceae bacterium]
MTYSEAQVARFWETQFAYLQCELKQHVLFLKLARPEAKNALSPTLVRELAFAMSYAHHQPEVWAMVLSAQGNVWCAGADLKAMRGQEEANDSGVPMPESPIVIGDLFVKVHKPIVARVHAPVYAGGHLLIAGCHFVLATEQATFSLPEVKRGLFPFQVMDMLLKILPVRVVLDWCIRGGSISATQAQTWGLVSELCPEAALDARLESLLVEIKQNSPAAIRLGLKAFEEMRSIPEAQKQAFLKQMLDQTIQTQDAQEGLKAFAEKRPPVWQGL